MGSIPAPASIFERCDYTIRPGEYDIFVALKPILERFSSVQHPYVTGEGVANVVSLLTLACICIVGIVFMWWGVRKVVQMVMSAFRSGRISL